MRVSKGRFASFVAGLAIAALASVSVPAVVQARSEMSLDIPFEFHVANQNLPAGHYTVAVSESYITVSDFNGHSAAALTNPVENRAWKNMNNAEVLVFIHYDGYYFLSEIRRAGYSVSHGLIKTSLEAEIAKNGNAKQPPVLLVSR